MRLVIVSPIHVLTLGEKRSRLDQRSLEGAGLGLRFAASVGFEEFTGACCEHAAYLMPGSFLSWDFHSIVSSRLVTHPSDHCGLGSLLDRDPFGSSYCSAAYRRCVFCDSLC